MADEAATSRFHFLYRQGEGVIDATEWSRAAWQPVAVALAVILPWVIYRPSLTEAELGARSQMAAFGIYAAYSAGLMISVVATLFAAVAEYSVSAKRFRDCGWSPAWAGLAPLAILVAGAMHWIAARDPEIDAAWLAYALDAMAALALGWTVITLTKNTNTSP
jgi:uncharacterized membrane protein YhaH (DUF805 family)